MNNQRPSDEELLRGVVAGDEESFTVLYRRRQAGIYRFALRMSGSEAAAEDVTQEVFLTLAREASRYDPARGPVTAYLFGIARKQVLRWVARTRLERAVDPLPEQAEPGAGPLERLAREESIEWVRAAVLSLPPHYREVVALCDLDGMSYEEAAATLECAVGTVRSRLHRARGLLAEKLRRSGVAEPAGVNRAGCLT
ncbi:MAG: RNA polymerase sigma factor [Acidobacteriota bacterium]